MTEDPVVGLLRWRPQTEPEQSPTENPKPRRDNEPRRDNKPRRDTTPSETIPPRLPIPPWAKQKDGIESWDTDPGFAKSVARLVGIEAALGETCPCPIPRCEAPGKSANLWRDSQRRMYVLRIHGHDHDGRRSFSLTETWAAQIAGRPLKISGPAHARWKLRLLAELGQLSLPAVRLPLLPADASDAVRRTYDGLRLLVAIRHAVGDTGPFPFTRRFVGPWCGLSDYQAERGKLELLRLGVIEKVGEIPSRHHPTSLYAVKRGGAA
jgi:hypothetical protein